MKKNNGYTYFLIFSFLILLFSCGDSANESAATESAENKYSYFGDSISASGATSALQVSGLIGGKDSIPLKIEGRIAEVCQKKGCWMEVSTGEGSTMHVTFKDYSFFVPKDVAGKTCIIEGYAFKDTIPVDHLRHLAEDAGKSKEEIEKITQPEITLSFEARGVIIK